MNPIYLLVLNRLSQFIFVPFPVISITREDKGKVKRASVHPPEYKDGILFDSVVPEGKCNNSRALLNLREAAIYDRSQVYPEYAVYYYRRAK